LWLGRPGQSWLWCRRPELRFRSGLRQQLLQ
jgi:hypothetical protein